MRISRRTIFQFSDLHVTPASRPLYASADTYAALVRALDDVRASGSAPSALLFTGDLAESGDEESYARVREAVGRAAGGVPALYAVGNHDDRAALRTALLGAPPSDDPLTGVWEVDGVRVAVLDTLVSGAGHGELTDGQLAWLAGVLATPAPLGTLLALHHPPIASPVADLEAITLRNPDALADVVRGSDVRLVTAGHAHHATVGTCGGVPVWVAPAMAYRIDVLGAEARVHARRGSGYTRIDVYDDAMTATYLPLDRGPVLARPDDA